MSAAPTASAFPHQLHSFLSNQPADAINCMKTLSPQEACQVMMRGALDMSPRSIPAAIIRRRIWDCNDDLAKMQQSFAKCRNGQLATWYDSLSIRDLEDELHVRSVVIGRDSGRTLDTLRDKLRATDASWAENALIMDIPTAKAAVDEAVARLSIAGSRKEPVVRNAIENAAAARIHRPYNQAGSIFRNLFFEIDRLCGKQSEETNKFIMLCVDLNRNDTAFWRLTTEALYHDLSVYSLSQMQDLVKKLRIKLHRRPTKPDFVKVLGAFFGRRNDLVQRLKHEESQTITRGDVRAFRKLPPDALKVLSLHYNTLSVEQLQEECNKRALANHVLETTPTGILKRPAASGAPGSVALQLRKRLRLIDVAFERHCPPEGYHDLNNKNLRSLCSARGVTRATTCNSDMIYNLREFEFQQSSAYLHSDVDLD
mmetsp:Transcript_136362/g.236099  ORF Transcript_136362/g.236099 Transcript_136362/m.236099 type:complete len:427 (-) Transcript_136362:138-1418(-)